MRLQRARPVLRMLCCMLLMLRILPPSLPLTTSSTPFLLLPACLREPLGPAEPPGGDPPPERDPPLPPPTSRAQEAAYVASESV